MGGVSEYRMRGLEYPPRRDPSQSTASGTYQTSVHPAQLPLAPHSRRPSEKNRTAWVTILRFDYPCMVPRILMSWRVGFRDYAKVSYSRNVRIRIGICEYSSTCVVFWCLFLMIERGGLGPATDYHRNTYTTSIETSHLHMAYIKDEILP